MEIVPAIAKVRFASARPQQVPLADGSSYRVDLLCLEAGQETRRAPGDRCYYVLMGAARITVAARSAELATGQMALLAADEPHSLANGGESRLVCLAISPASSR